jgi:GT2 family glycosyltransferase
MTTPEPVLSIVLPVFNRAGSLRRALDSVLASAVQARVAPGEVEVIVVDDGSTDASGDAARAFAARAGSALAVTTLRQDNAGPAAARNLGLSRARAPHVAFLDSDDLWFDWTMAACLRAVAALPDAALFFLKPCVFTDGRAPVPTRKGGSSLSVHDGFVAASQNCFDRSFGTNNVIVRRDVIERLDGFAVEFRCLEDTDLFLRADPEGPCVIFEGDDLLGRQRGHCDSLTDDWAWVLDGFQKMKRKERAGLYPKGRGGDPRRLALYAGTAVRASRLCFANGRPGKAYGVFFRNLGIILRGGKSRWVWRLPFTPLLSMLRPQNYPFRLRPAALS